VTARHLGVDIGGTNCKLALLETAGDRAGQPPRLLATTTVPTGSGDPGEVVERVAAAAAGLLAGHGPVAGAGVGVPGLFDEDSGRTLLLPNLPAAWNGYQFRGPLADRLGVPTALINDARSFALARAGWARPPAARPWSA
jgi:predicted NBD/HSP70 family sugar kinase